jgi:hypothetical protein
MRVLESFARNWRAGSFLFVPCGPNVPRRLTSTELGCLLTGRMPSCQEEPMRTIEQRPGTGRGLMTFGMR